MASAGSPFRANDILDDLAAGFSRFESSAHNEFRVAKVRNPEKLVHVFIERTFESDEAMTLSLEEVASICHFPASAGTPRVKWLNAKEAPWPENLPREGLLLGDAIFRGKSKPAYLADGDRGRHLYAIGQAGTGKSAFLANLALEDIKAGKGVAIIDPQGDIVERVRGLIPESRLPDVVSFDPAAHSRPHASHAFQALNILEHDPSRPEEKAFIASEVHAMFSKLFPPETIGPLFEPYLRNTLLLLLDNAANEPATLLDVPRLFNDTHFRSHKLEGVKNTVVEAFWKKALAQSAGKEAFSSIAPHIIAKFHRFTSDAALRPVLSHAKSSFNFEEIMDSRKIMLVNLAKGKANLHHADLVGMIFMAKIMMAARAGKHSDFNIYIDEFQDFTTNSFAAFLPEAHKYGVNFTLAHQRVAQLPDTTRKSVFSHAGSMAAFRVGPQDAEFLAKQFAPTFNQNDLMNIENLNAYAKVSIGGKTSHPFKLRIFIPSTP